MNPIQPPSNRPPEISVTDPVSAAFERVKQVLFRPFDLGKWFVIGFCAWLALLGQQGGGGGGGGNYNFGSQRHGHRSLADGFAEVKNYILDNIGWILPLAIGIIVVIIVVGLLFNWLSSRGKFMFVHCVALNKAEVVTPWNEYAREANSLFWFRLGLGLIGFIVTLPLVILIAVLVIVMVKAGAASVPGVAGAVGALLLLIALSLVFLVIRKLTMDFVVPIMYLRRRKCLAGWRELRGLFQGNLGNFILYFLFQIVLGFIITMLILAVVIATCCLAGCLMLLPYLGTVLLLPVHVFERAYSLSYLAQFGPEFNVFPTPPASLPPFPTSGSALA